MTRGRAFWFCGVGFVCFIVNVQTTVAFPFLLNDEDKVEILKRSENVLGNWLKISNNILSEKKKVNFNLYTRKNLDVPYLLMPGKLDNLKESPLIQNRPTKIIIHGWLENSDIYWLEDYRREYLAAGNCNIIIVDWDALSWTQYPTAVDSLYRIGKRIAKLIKFLDRNGYISPAKVHMLGYSLGAHIAGFAGYVLKGRVGRITGLDPARPLFEFPILKEEKARLDPSDAQFVEVIHTCAGNIAFENPLGHVDFYANGGYSSQPGCSLIGSFLCCHVRSVLLFLESIKSPRAFIATKCKSWTNYTSGKCTNGTKIFVGKNMNPKARGSFFFETNEKSPFGKGIIVPQNTTQAIEI